MKNCLCDIVAVNPEIIYIVLYDHMRELIVKLIDISKAKVNL